ncbi:MAG: hypothetical protein O3C10_03790 [Chloroflexi bacterium]|nr:hypothetical protein [Chloroflexota bacterium]
MAPIIDTGEVILIGENSFIRLSHDGGETVTERVSHWRVLWTPAGPGHVLFYEGEMIGGEPRIYSDNIALARFVQSNIEGLLYPPSGDTSLPVHDAEFAREGDSRSYSTERISSDVEEISLTWTDLQPPFVMHAPGGNGEGERPLSVWTTFVQAREARITVDGDFASGEPFENSRLGRPVSSAVLAWAETWAKLPG